MRRRSALATLAALGSSVLAGCSLDRERIHDDPPTVRPSTEMTERTPTATATPEESTPRPGDVPADRVVDGEAVAENGVGVTADRWFALDEIRYENGDGGHETVTADRGWFVAWEFTVANRGDDGVDSLPDSVFELRVDGETYAHIHEFPGGVQFDALDQPDSEPQIRALAWYSGPRPRGGRVPPAGLRGAGPARLPALPGLGPLIARRGRASEPVYLTGRRTLPGGE